MSNQLSEMIQCAKGCTPPPDAGWIKGVTSALCYTVCLWRAVHVHKCIDTQLHVSDPINLGIKVPVGDFDLWPNGGSQSSNCNRHNYFGDVVCSHVEAKLLFSATMRVNCHMARKCRSYRQYKSGRCGNKALSPIGWNLVANEINQDFPNNYYMDTEFTSGDFCGLTDVPFSTSSMITTDFTTTSPINRGIQPVKGIKRGDEVPKEPKYSKWCLGMSWFGLCKSKTASERNISIKIQFGDISDATTTSSTTSTTLPPTTLQTTFENETVWTQRSMTIESSSKEKINSVKTSRKRYSTWCLGMSWFGLCASKTVDQPTQANTTTTTTTSTTTSTATTTTTQTYSDNYDNYY